MTVEARLGCIADDYTGGTDVASALRREGLGTVLLFGPPRPDWGAGHADAVVVALKSRNRPRPMPWPSPDRPAVAAPEGIGRLYFNTARLRLDRRWQHRAGRRRPVEAAGPAHRRLPDSPDTADRHQGHLFVGDRLLSNPRCATTP